MPSESEPSIWIRPEPPRRRRGLSRAAIVQTAVQLADERGAEAVTMQAVAHALGAFTPMSLYRHIYSKENLVDAMLDLVLGEVELPTLPSTDWQADVYALETRTWAMCLRHPWYARLVHTRPPLGPNALRRTEYLLQVFRQLGADLGTAMGYVSLVERLVIGLAQQVDAEARAQPEVDFSTPSGAEAALAPLRTIVGASDAYPNLAQWAAAPFGPSPEEQLQLGLTMLLDGIAARYPHAQSGGG